MNIINGIFLKNSFANYFSGISELDFFIANVIKISWILLFTSCNGNSLGFPLWTVLSLAYNASLVSSFPIHMFFLLLVLLC